MKGFLVFIGFASLQCWSPFVLPGMKILLFQYERHREIACCLLSATIFWKRLIHREFRLQRCLLLSHISEQCKVLFYRIVVLFLFFCGALMIQFVMCSCGLTV